MATITDRFADFGFPTGTAGIDHGLSPLPGNEQWFFIDDPDEDKLDIINDIVKYFPIAVDTSWQDVVVQMGDHDANGTPLGVWSVVYNDGTTEFEIIRDVNIGRLANDDASVARIGGGTASDVSKLGTRVTTDGAYIGLKTTTAPATLQTSARKVSMAVLIRGRAADRT